MIYFLRSIDTGLIRIGVTNDLRTRFQRLSGAHGPLEILGMLEGGYSEKKTIHKQFAELSIDGDWFLAAPALLQFIDRKGKTWDGSGKPPRTGSTKIDSDLLQTARAVAFFRAVRVSDYLSSLIREPVRQDWRDCLQKMAETPGRDH